MFVTSCNTVKRVPDGKHLLTKNTVYINGSKKGTSELNKYILQKPNSTTLGLPVPIYFYNLGNKNKPKTPKAWGEKNKRSYKFISAIFSEKQAIAYANSFIGLNNWYLKSGQAPVTIDDRKTALTVKNLKTYFTTKGYFKTLITTEKKTKKNKKGSVSYFISRGNPLEIEDITYNISSPVLDSLFNANLDDSHLLPDDQYDEANFKAEADRITKLFRNNGVYHFNINSIGYHGIDSTATNNRTMVNLKIDDRIVEENGNYTKRPYKRQRVSRIKVYTDYSYTKKNQSVKDYANFDGIGFVAFEKLRYNPRYLSKSIFFKPGVMYSDSLRNLTRNHLKSLKNFKSTNIQFRDINENELEANIFLTPNERYTIGAETELTHSNIRDIGISAKFSLINRNTFRAAETFKLSGLGTYFTTSSGTGFEVGVDASLEIPRFYAPFGLNRFVPKRMSPRTLFSVGSSFQKNIGLDRRTISGLVDFTWKPNRKKTIQLEIFNTQYVKNVNVNNYFGVYTSEFQNLSNIAEVIGIKLIKPLKPGEEQTNIDPDAVDPVKFMTDLSQNNAFLASNPTEFQNNLNILNRYNIVTSDFIIPTVSYTFNYNSQTDFKDNSFSSVRLRLANSGNFLGSIFKAKNTNEKTTFLDIPLAQYFKIDLEYKKFWDFGGNSVFGIRTLLGGIIPYDNSDIPFTKSYFVGGSNDIRAWRTYELGPGTQRTGLEFNIGSLKFLTSAEYRFDIVGTIKGALFVDAGNVWDITNSNLVNDSAKFKGIDSLNDLAVGGGFGVRLDFSFLVARLDLGFKMHEPYLSGNRWFQNFRLSKAVYNIGINYPF